MEDMNELELKKVALQKYADLQRIKRYGQEELDYQEKLIKAELQSYGVKTEDLELQKI